MQLMSIEDLAAYLGDSKRTIYKYIASGECPPYMRISAKNIKFDRADVDAWLESKKVYPGPGGKEMSDISLVDNAKGMIKNAVRKGKLPWTPRAKAVLKRAQKKASEDGFDLVGTEHILFGIVSVKDCLGAVILRNLGVAASKCNKRYEQLCEAPSEKGAGKAKLSDDIHNVVKCAYEQSSAWGHEYIGAEHLLIGIFLAGAGLGFQILTDLGITPEKVREETRKLIVCRDIPEEGKGK
jgi:excisionase family DNA binding protein